MNQTHFNHLVSQSPWPILTANSLLLITTGLILTMQYITNSILTFGVILLIIMFAIWGRDVVREGTHLLIIHLCSNWFKIWLGLFIISEAFFFLGFFWAFFHAALAPAVSIGAIWPPAFMKV